MIVRNVGNNNDPPAIVAPVGITGAISAIDARIQENTWFWNNNFNNFK